MQKQEQESERFMREMEKKMEEKMDSLIERRKKADKRIDSMLERCKKIKQQENGSVTDSTPIFQSSNDETKKELSEDDEETAKCEADRVAYRSYNG